MNDDDLLPRIQDIPTGWYAVRLEREIMTRGVFDVPQKVVIFKVIDVEPDIEEFDKKKDPNKVFIGRTILAYFQVESENTETKGQAETQYGFLREALKLGRCKVRVEKRRPVSNPSRLRSEAVEFLPFSYEDL